MSDNVRPHTSSEGTAEGKTWFDHMTGYLKWKIIGPDINNPFKNPIPYHSLTRMATQRDYLAQHIQIRCMCDGYEVMVIANPANPRIISNHPCISMMDQTLIVDYIQRTGLDEFIDGEIDRIREEIKNHLSKRAKEKEEQTHYLGSLKKKKVAIVGRTEDGASRSKNFRIIKK